MTEAEIRRVVATAVTETLATREHNMEQVVKETVKETLLTLGLDVTDPMQIQADFRHLRVWRLSLDTVRKQGLVAAVGFIVTAIMGALWLAFKPGMHP